MLRGPSSGSENPRKDLILLAMLCAAFATLYRELEIPLAMFSQMCLPHVVALDFKLLKVDVIVLLMLDILELMVLWTVLIVDDTVDFILLRADDAVLLMLFHAVDAVDLMLFSLLDTSLWILLQAVLIVDLIPLILLETSLLILFHAVLALVLILLSLVAVSLLMLVQAVLTVFLIALWVLVAVFFMSFQAFVKVFWISDSAVEKNLVMDDHADVIPLSNPSTKNLPCSSMTLLGLFIWKAFWNPSINGSKMFVLIQLPIFLITSQMPLRSPSMVNWPSS